MESEPKVIVSPKGLRLNWSEISFLVYGTMFGNELMGTVFYRPSLTSGSPSASHDPTHQRDIATVTSRAQRALSANQES